MLRIFEKAIPKLPKVIPSETICWFDLEGVLMEDNISLYLFRLKPSLAIKAVLNGFVKASCRKLRDLKKDFNEEWIKECKKYYVKKMSRDERYVFGKLIYQLQSKKHKEDLKDTLKVSKIDDGYEIYVITAGDYSVATGFLESLPEELYIARENIFASHEDGYVDRKGKASIVRYIKAKGKKKTMGFADTSFDVQALEETDVPCMVSTRYSLLMPLDIRRGYRVYGLGGVKKFLDAIHYDLFMSRKNDN